MYSEPVAERRYQLLRATQNGRHHRSKEHRGGVQRTLIGININYLVDVDEGGLSLCRVLSIAFCLYKQAPPSAWKGTRHNVCIT